MATTSYGTPMGMGTQPMGMRTSGVRNMNLPMSSARPIEVDENTSNLEEIQGFPVAGTTADGTHFHQDPVTGQMYKMSADLHQRIPQILINQKIIKSNLNSRNTIIPLIRGNLNIPYESGDIKNSNSIQDYDFIEKKNLYRNSKILFNEILKNSNDLVESYSGNTAESSTTFVKKEFIGGDFLNPTSFEQNQSNTVDVLYSTQKDQNLNYEKIDDVKKQLNTPINNFVNNNSTEIIQENKSYLSIPVNKFISKNDFYKNGIDMLRFFIPINKFINK